MQSGNRWFFMCATQATWLAKCLRDRLWSIGKVVWADTTAWQLSMFVEIVAQH